MEEASFTLSKIFNQQVSFQVNIKYLISQFRYFSLWFMTCCISIYFKCVSLEFREETTPQSSRVLESSTKFLHICASRKLFRNPKTLEITKKLFMQEYGYHSGLIRKDKVHKNLTVSPFLPGVDLRVDH